MDTIDNSVSRLMDLASDTPPWEQAIEEMGRAVADHIMEQVQEMQRNAEHHLYASLKQELVKAVYTEISAHVHRIAQDAAKQTVKPYVDGQEEVKKMIEALPSLIRLAVEGVPDVVVQTPQPQQVHKKINYDAMDTPVDVVETRVF